MSGFDDYICSQEFIERFGDWEKANRLEKLKVSEPIKKNDRIFISGNDVTEVVESLIENEDRKALQLLEKECGKSILGSYKNEDTGLSVNVYGRSVIEISNHHYLFKEHIQALGFVPEIIEKSIYIDEVENEDKNRRPDIKKYLYFGIGLKIGENDYTCKSVIGIDGHRQCYYDQSLSTIEKGKLVDYIFLNKKVGNVSPLITQREADFQDNKLPYVYYDKRLLNICQVPQLPYMKQGKDGRWLPTGDAVKAVRNGQLFVRKDGQRYVMCDLRHQEGFSQDKATYYFMMASKEPVDFVRERYAEKASYWKKVSTRGRITPEEKARCAPGHKWDAVDNYVHVRHCLEKAKDPDVVAEYKLRLDYWEKAARQEFMVDVMVRALSSKPVRAMPEVEPDEWDRLN